MLSFFIHILIFVWGTHCFQFCNNLDGRESAAHNSTYWEPETPQPTVSAKQESHIIVREKEKHIRFLLHLKKTHADFLVPIQKTHPCFWFSIGDTYAFLASILKTHPRFFSYPKTHARFIVSLNARHKRTKTLNKTSLFQGLEPDPNPDFGSPGKLRGYKL